MPRILLPPLLALAAVTSAPAAEWASVYDRLSPRVSIQREGDEVVAIPPAARGSAFELRFPAFPSLRPEPLPAPPAIVGLAVGGAVIVNTEPRQVPLAAAPAVASFSPGVEVPRRPGFGSDLDLSGLLGVLLDGYPLYGPVERDGSSPEDLDECHGHVGLTPDTERAEYHYHLLVAARSVAPCLRGLAGSALLRPSP